MKLLILSWYFPPVNTIGAVRVGKFARFMRERGHEIGVIAGRNWTHPETLPLGFALENASYVGARKVSPIDWLRGRAGAGDEPRGDLAGHLQALLAHLVQLPDNRVGWLPNAFLAGQRLCRRWRPDLMFATAPPFTACIAAHRLCRKLGLPWVAELRDRWADDPYAETPGWKRAIDDWMERRTLASAAGLVTVTEPWAEFYRGKYRKPVATIYNGYDPADFPAAPESVAPSRDPLLVIGYTGSIYPGRRDPSPLFEALRLMGAEGERFRVVFVGTDPAAVWPLAERAQVKHLVEVRPPLTYAQSLAFQQRADVLLLMQWNDPREQGNCPGKFFEYLASLRPVLVLGLENGVPATIARERGAGVCLNEPGAIAAQLGAWRREKDANGFLPAIPAGAREGLSRTLQYEKLEAFLAEVLAVTRSDTAGRPALTGSG